MEDSGSPSGRFWPSEPEIEQPPEASPVVTERSSSLSLATERWIGVVAVVLMIALSDYFMYRTWH